MSWETLARELLSECQVDDLQRVCKLLGVADDDAFIDDDADLGMKAFVEPIVKVEDLSRAHLILRCFIYALKIIRLIE